MKRSGHGRENGPGAIEEFMQLKSYWLSYAQAEPEPFIMRLQRPGESPVGATRG
ncbi:hypothetical protein [Paraburkholderia polaris]|uniref:hypothetical protein n=1 Tax=Paraburkholderia polaris TaxID=2728848 RepID=UPI002E30D1C7|nr:hypothetical protein [Paraburkholderia polaris]